MTSTKRHVAAFVISLFVLAVAGMAAGAEVISGTIYAVRSTDPGFEGAWKYCATVTWDTGNSGGKPRALSHLSLLPGLEMCRFACDYGYFAFADTVGMSYGPDSCTVYYHGDYTCKGDPTLPDNAPALKFEPYPDDSCAAGASGMISFCFYSHAAPELPDTYPDALWIKFGQNVAFGPLVGALPTCSPPSDAVEATTWGAIKALIH